MELFNPKTDTIQNIRFLKQQNLVGEQLIQKGLFRELINQYGIDVSYFRKKLDFYHEGGGTRANYIYGESPSSEYDIAEDMVVYMSVSDDTPLLNKFGLETNVTAEIFFMKDDFKEIFRDRVGKEISTVVSIPVEVIVRNWVGTVKGNFSIDDLRGDVEFSIAKQLANRQAGPLKINATTKVTRAVEFHNPMIAVSTAYTERSINGTVTGELTGGLSPTGNGVLTGTMTGTLTYHTTNVSDNNMEFWKISPQVGDFVRMREFSDQDENYEEYEISAINDKELTPSGLNPLLHKYIWKCSVRRRVSSHEAIVVPKLDSAGNVQRDKDGDPVVVDQHEKYTQNNTALHKLLQNNESDGVFDYGDKKVDRFDGVDSDDVYGGF